MFGTDYQIRIDRIKRMGERKVNPEISEELIRDARSKDLLEYSGNLDKWIDRCIRQYSAGKNLTLKDDIWKACVLNLIDPDEYFWYKFNILSQNLRDSFVGNREKEYLCYLINDPLYSNIFSDKWESFLRFSKYYKREVILITSLNERIIFRSFCEKHKKVCIKNPLGSKGNDVYIIEESQWFIGWNYIEAILLKHGKVIVEQSIVQSSIMELYNPSSVNTVRIATFRENGETSILFAFALFGRCGNYVNNGGRGG